jgi:catechol 2,3-dioxygenase-like lactoylglutathione lyase family enzyme
VSDGPRLSLSTVNIEAPDASELARFYTALLGWPLKAQESDWVMLENPDGGVRLSFQTEPGYVRPVWPARTGDQQMMMHLEIRVDDLDAAVEHAVSVGAVVADHQPAEDTRVCLDPAGHPFCLWVTT